MGLLSDRLRFSFRRSPPPSPAGLPPDPPPEFLCPISGELMVDPVIISSGETFDRICIEAFKDLSFNSSSSSSSLLLIPNSALRSAILRWCDNSGVAHPISLSSEIAVCCARRLLSSSTSKAVLLSSNIKLQANCSTELPNGNTSSIIYSSSSSDNYSSPSSCSTEMIPLKSQKSVLLSPNAKLQANCLMELPNENSSSITCFSSSSEKHSCSSSCSTEITLVEDQKSVLLSPNTKPQANCLTELPNENSSSITCFSCSSDSHSCSSSWSTEITPVKDQKSVLLSPNTKLQANCSTKLPNENSSSITYSSSSSNNHSSSSSSSTEIIPLETPKSVLLSSNSKPQANCSTELPNEKTFSSSDPLEDKILHKLKHPQIQEQENALISLLEATRESTSRRISLCSTTLLAALRRLLLSRHPTVQSTALAIIVNLSLEPCNKIPIVRSGSIPSIINLLQSSSKQNATNEATKRCDPNLYCFEKKFVAQNAAGALFSLSLEEQNRTAIGVLGAIPPLLSLFRNSNEDFKTRLEAGMALFYLVFEPMNLKKLARVSGAIKSLIAVAMGDESERELRKLAMRMMVGMVGCKEGKNAIFDGGAIEAIVKMLSKEEEEVEEEEEEMVIMILYGISIKGLRFRGIGRRIGMEEVLERFIERLEGEKREMVRMIIMVLRGEEEKERDFGGILCEEEGSSSEMVVVRRRRNCDSGGGSCPGLAGF